MAEAIPQSRRVLLWVMLGSLGAAAAAGVFGVVVPGIDIVGRVIGMAVATAVCCGLIMSAGRYFEKAEQRLSATVAIGLILFEYLLCLVMIWGLANTFLPMRRAEEAPGMSMAFVAATGIPIVWMCRLIFDASTRIAGFVGVFLFGVALMILLAGAWWNGNYRQTNEIVGTGFSIEAFVFPLVACLVGLGTGERGRWFRWIGLAASVLGCGILCNSAIRDLDISTDFTFICSAVIAAFVAHLNLSLRAPLPPGLRWLRWITVAAIAVTGVLIIYIVGFDSFNHNRYDNDLDSRLIAAGAICAGCGTLAMLIITRMNRKAEHVMVAPADLHEIQLQCPACQTKQTLPLGDGKCSECGLRFLIKIDEPRCETCGYLLYRLKSDRCPECGTPVNTGMTNDQTRMTNEIPMPNVQ
jgi:drug/metabolite transporter (DMT)-like permease